MLDVRLSYLHVAARLAHHPHWGALHSLTAKGPQQKGGIVHLQRTYDRQMLFGYVLWRYRKLGIAHLGCSRARGLHRCDSPDLEGSARTLVALQHGAL